MIKIIKKARGVNRNSSFTTLSGLYRPARYPATIAIKTHKRMYFLTVKLKLFIFTINMFLRKASFILHFNRPSCPEFF